jgi:hypothetical protein
LIENQIYALFSSKELFPFKGVENVLNSATQKMLMATNTFGANTVSNIDSQLNTHAFVILKENFNLIPIVHWNYKKFDLQLPVILDSYNRLKGFKYIYFKSFEALMSYFALLQNTKLAKLRYSFETIDFKSWLTSYCVVNFFLVIGLFIFQWIIISLLHFFTDLPLYVLTSPFWIPHQNLIFGYGKRYLTFLLLFFLFLLPHQFLIFLLLLLLLQFELLKLFHVLLLLSLLIIVVREA